MRSLRTAVVALAAAAALALSLAPTVQSANAETVEETAVPTEPVATEAVTTDPVATEAVTDPVPTGAVAAEEPVPLSEAFTNPEKALQPDTVLSPAAAADTAGFIASLVEAARRNQADTGIPASVAIGQAALETGWGRSKMSQDPINSYFSIKCGGTTPYASGCVDVSSREYGSNGWYEEVSSFRTYASVGDSLLDYGRLLSANRRYQGAFKYSADPDNFIREVHSAGYATDPNYSTTVIGIMVKYNLYRYDLPTVPTAGFNPDWKPKPLPSAPARPDVIPAFVPGPDFPAYTSGAKEHGVQTLQYLLNAYGGSALVVDGVFGSASRDAVSSWQRRVGAGVTGVMDDKSWSALLPKLTQGARGEAVTAVQLELNQAGFKVPTTGSFDATTADAVRAFQRHHLIRPTGEVTAVVWARLLDW